jgi:hypothetical protein
MTTDADFLVERIDGIAEAFQQEGYVVTPAGEAHGDPEMLLVRGRGDRIDILFATLEYQNVALERAVEHVLAVEDVIVHKLIAWRPRDRNDIASILAAGHQLDVAYIEHWAGVWDVSDRWQQAWAAR